MARKELLWCDEAMHPAASNTHRVTTTKTGPAHGRQPSGGSGVLKGFLTVSLGLCLASVFPACTTAEGAGWKYASFATDTEGLEVSPSGMKAAKLNQSIAFGKTADTIRGMWTNYLISEGVRYFAGKYFDQAGTELSNQQTLKLEELRNAKSVADAEAAMQAAQQAASLS